MMDGCTLVILAGGASRRMGRDKAALPAAETTVAERLIRRLAPVVDQVIIAGGSLEIPGVRRVPDRRPGLGPLAGMQTGFEVALHPLVWVVACDLPDVTPALLSLLRSNAADVDAVVPVAGGEVQGLCALYRRRVSSRIDDLLATNRRSVQALLSEIRARYLDQRELRAVDPELDSFRNLNTPAEYDAWLRRR